MAQAQDQTRVHRPTTMTFEETVDTSAEAYRYGMLTYSMGEKIDGKKLKAIKQFERQSIQKGIGDWTLYKLAMYVIGEEEKGNLLDDFYLEILSWRRERFNTSLVKAFPAKPSIEPQKLFPGYKKYDVKPIK